MIILTRKQVTTLLLLLFAPFSLFLLLTLFIHLTRSAEWKFIINTDE